MTDATTTALTALHCEDAFACLAVRYVDLLEAASTRGSIALSAMVLEVPAVLSFAVARNGHFGRRRIDKMEGRRTSTEMLSERCLTGDGEQKILKWRCLEGKMLGTSRTARVAADIQLPL